MEKAKLYLTINKATEKIPDSVEKKSKLGGRNDRDSKKYGLSNV